MKKILIGTGVPISARAAVDDTGADLIVVDARQFGSLKHAVLGTTSRELLTRTRRPVLIASEPRVPQPAAV